jgi:hypothetical protein
MRKLYDSIYLNNETLIIHGDKTNQKYFITLAHVCDYKEMIEMA